MTRTETRECGKCGKPTLQPYYCVVCYGKYVVRGDETLEDAKRNSQRRS